MIKRHPLKGANRLKLGVFSTNADGGLAITTVPERWRARWDDNMNAAQIADRAGLEFMLPIARWKGVRRPDPRARMVVRDLHLGGGAGRRHRADRAVHDGPRPGDASALRGQGAGDRRPNLQGPRRAQHRLRLESLRSLRCSGSSSARRATIRPAEWLDVLEKAYASNEPFDYNGSYYQLKQVVSRPASVQVPRPVTMNAAFGGPGRDFAAKHCEYIFTTFSELDGAQKHVVDIGERASKAGRQVGLYTVCHVVCRETPAEADAYYERYALTEADHAAVETHMAGKKEFSSSHDSDAYDRYRQRFAGGAGSYPLVGTPEKIAEEMIAISQIGYAGIALSLRELHLRVCPSSATVCCHFSGKPACGPRRRRMAMADNPGDRHATDAPATGPVRFRQGMRCLAGSVTVVALQGVGGTLLGVTATAVCSLSAEPPSLIACINKASLLASGLKRDAMFSVNILSEHQEDIASAFGGAEGACRAAIVFSTANGTAAIATFRCWRMRGRRLNAASPISWITAAIAPPSVSSSTSI